jgi:hypothetical protein
VSGNWQLNIPAAAIRAAASAGLQDFAETVLAEAQGYAPVLTGELRDSGSVQVDGLEAAIGFSDSKASAAHENLTAHLRNGKKPKFLELAVHEHAPEMERVVGEHVRGVLG